MNTISQETDIGLILLVTSKGYYLEYKYGSLLDLIPEKIPNNVHISEILPIHIADRFIKAIADTLETGAVQLLKYSINTSGDMEIFRARFYHLNSDLVMVTVQNDTDIYINHLKLNNTNTLFKSILEGIVVEVMVFNNDGNLIFTNRDDVKHNTPHTIEEAIEIGLNFAKAENKIPYEREELPIYRAMHGEIVNEVLVSKDGINHPKTFIVHAAPLISKSGKKQGVLMTSRDITHIETLRSKVNSKTKDLEAFLYRASHDLKSPLVSIKGILDFTKMRVSEPEILKYLGMIEKSHSLLTTTVEDLVNLSHITRKEESLSVINLKLFINKLIQSLRYLPQAKDIKLKAYVPDGLTIKIDESQFLAVLQNLITNAINHHHKSGDDRYILVMVQDRLDNVLIEVIDNGIGIPEKIQSQIYDVFFRGNPNVPGSGLGLFIVKEATQKLAGSINVESEPGKGCTFNFVVPKR